MAGKNNIFIHCLLAGILLAGISSPVFSQTGNDTIPMPQLGPNDTIPVPAIVYQGEYIPGGSMEWTWVTAPYPKELLKKRQEWTRLRNAIYVTYPYAKKAGAIMNEINAKIS